MGPQTNEKAHRRLTRNRVRRLCSAPTSERPASHVSFCESCCWPLALALFQPVPGRTEKFIEQLWLTCSAPFLSSGDPPKNTLLIQRPFVLYKVRPDCPFHFLRNVNPYIRIFCCPVVAMLCASSLRDSIHSPMQAEGLEGVVRSSSKRAVCDRDASCTELVRLSISSDTLHFSLSVLKSRRCALGSSIESSVSCTAEVTGRLVFCSSAHLSLAWWVRLVFRGQ